MPFPASVRRSVPLLVAALLLSACGSTGGDAISKVKILRLLPQANQPGASDRAIGFERRHRLHGAVTREEIDARTGNYYTIFWSVADRSAPVTLRFQYRQAKTGPKIHVIEQTIEKPNASNVAEFQIIGKAYEQQGPVLNWRLQLLRGREVLTTRDSYLWK